MVFQRVNVLGVGITVLNLELARRALMEAVAAQSKGYVCVTGVHGVMEAQQNPEFRTILNQALLCTPDGMPMVWAGRRAGFGEMDRVYGPDLMNEIFKATAASGHTHFLYGGGDGIAAELRTALQKRYPGIRIVGVYTPPFRPLNPGEEAELRQQVEQSKPDFFWVGLSTPKQEKFMAAYLPKLPVKIMLGVGAGFDFYAGKVKQAPRWIQRSGFEWLFRLCMEPKRLWRRYLSNNPRFIWKRWLQVSGLARYNLD